MASAFRVSAQRASAATGMTALCVLLLMACGAPLARGGEGPRFTVVDDHGTALLPAGPLSIIDVLRCEGLRAPIERELRTTLNLLSSDAPPAAFAARLSWPAKDLAVELMDPAGQGGKQDWPVATLTLYLIRRQESGMWAFQLRATGTDGRTCHAEKYDPGWAITVSDLAAAYYLKLLPAVPPPGH